VNVLRGPGEHVQLTDRVTVVQWLRVVLAVSVLVIGFVESETADIVPLVAAYLVLTAGVELARRRAPGVARATMSWALLVDGVFLALALALTGGTTSWVRVLVFFHVTAVTLVVSYRTGLKLAVWYALLLFLGHAAAAADLLGENTTGSYGDAAVTSILLLLFAAGTAVCSSACGGRASARRRRRCGRQGRLDFPRAVVFVRHGDGWKGASATAGGTIPTTTTAAGIATLREHLWRSATPTLVRTLEEDPVLEELLPGARNVVVVPLVADGDALGIALAEWGRGPRAQIPAVTVETLAQSASQAAIALRNAALLSEVEHLATRDGLTGLSNRRLFEETLQREVARSHRRKAPLALVVLDVDHFKDVNDTVGHQAGDEVLREVAQAMVGHTKASDLPARYGGDEFVVLLPDCTAADALVVAERLRAAVAHEVSAVPVTVSAGVGAMPDNAGDGERLVAAADAALYAAKREGRDRSVASTRAAEPGEAPAHPALRRSPGV
jgi:diguanylate cyclase (GGDEF)-like protein